MLDWLLPSRHVYMSTRKVLFCWVYLIEVRKLRQCASNAVLQGLCKRISGFCCVPAYDASYYCLKLSSPWTSKLVSAHIAPKLDWMVLKSCIAAEFCTAFGFCSGPPNLHGPSAAAANAGNSSPHPQP
jgi:hypothetical protein